MNNKDYYSKVCCLVLENFPEGVVYASRKTGEIYYVNRKFSEITGLKSDNVKNIEVLNSIVFNKDAFKIFLDRFIASKSETILEGKNKNGEKIYIKFTLSSINSDEFLIIVNDVTQEIIQRRNLLEITSRLNIYSNIDSIFIKYRPPELYRELLNFIKEILNAKYAFVGFVDENKNAFKFYFMSEEVSNFCKIGEVLDYKLFAKKGSIWAKTIENGMPYVINEKRHINGHIPIDNAISIPIKYGNETIGVMMFANRDIGWDNDILNFIEDITKYISQRVYYILDNEKLINQMIELKSKENAIIHAASIAAGYAHDLNNMLVPVLTNISLLEEKIEDVNLLEMIHESREFLNAAVNLIKGFTNLSNPSMLELSEISIKELKNMILFIAKGFFLNVNFKTEKGIEDLVIKTDKLKIYQIFSNIIKNAAEAMRSKIEKKIDVSIRLMDRDIVEIGVRDYGLGIPDNVKQDIFKPYFTTKKEGKGLGLFMAYTIIKALGGDIIFSSEEGRGTIFVVKIPLKIKQQVNTAICDDEDRKGTLNILVVDDENFVIKSITKILRYLGHNVYSASNMSIALDIIKNNPIDIAIVDLVLENESGVDVGRKLKDINPSIFLVVSTGYTDDNIIADIENYKFDYYLPKPYTLEMVKNLICVYFSSKK